MHTRRHQLGLRRQAVQPTTTSVLGTSHLALIVVAACFFGAAGVYLFAVNEQAVYGYDMRSVERELTALKKENAQLRLREAEGRSLARVEAGSLTLRMERAEPKLQLTVERSSPVAYH